LLKDEEMSQYGRSMLAKISEIEKKIEDHPDEWSSFSKTLLNINDELLKKRSEYAGSIGHPINELNQSRYDKFGWIPASNLVDSEISDWAYV